MKPGVAFPDFIRSEKTKRLRHASDVSDSAATTRDYFLLLFLGIAVVLLLTRLLYLQFFQGSYYRALSDSNRIKTTTIHAPRGIIFDRNKVPLVYNIPGFRQIVGDKTRFLNRDTATILMAKGEKGIEVDVHRSYPFKEAFAHIVGYVGQISEDELKNPLYKDYKPRDIIGKSGIEKEYQSLLVGNNGKTLEEVDNTGGKIRTLGQTEGVSGQDVYTTLDSKLQVAAYNALPKDKKGVVIVSNPRGEILAIVSKPAFDPNLFTLDETYQTATDSAYQSVDSILADTQSQPLLNRAIGGTYPPGSTFKLVTAAAALENGVVDTNFQIEDTGIMHVGAFSFGNWYYLQYGGKEGSVDVIKAIKRSNDIYFYQVAQKVGLDRLSDMASEFGLGKKLGIDMEGELSGVVPTDAWKKEAIGEPWYLGDTYHYGIGQGYLLTTPLQINMMTSAVANRGVLVKPHLLKNSKFQILNSQFVSEQTLKPIISGMEQSCQPTGVAWPLFQFKVQNAKLQIDNKNFFAVPESTASANFKDYRHVTIACKTGTAQHGGLTTMPHAWITLFAPIVDPQIIVTVLVDSGGEGSSIAGPVAKKVLEEWFNR